MLMIPKTQRQVCRCLPSQDAVPSQLKACRGDSAPAQDAHLCPERGKGECRGAGGRRAGRCSLVAQSFKRTSEIQVQPSAHPSPQNRATLFCCPQSCPSLSLWVPWAGRDSGEMCTSAERAGGGEDEPDNYYLESFTRMPSKIMAQILRKGAL